MGELIGRVNDLVWGAVLVWALLGAGIYFTVRFKGVQVRWFRHMVKTLFASRNDPGESISSFQAFATGLAARVGTGNIAGIGVAIYLGGPGAIFWMWVIAMLGMATSFAETILAQVFKERMADGSFRGGPAYYMQKGLGARWLGVLFSVFLMMSYGLIFNMVQSNSMAAAARAAFGAPELMVALIVAVLAALVIFGGIQRIGRFAEAVVPAMAILYLMLAIVVCIMNLGELPSLFLRILESAFAPHAAGAGALGYTFKVALMNGVRRGLFSNEAGMGSVPNAAAAATVDHPVQQGMVQMFGVFIDTIIVCSCTAAFILLSDALAPGSGLTGVELTSAALVEHVGQWGAVFLTVAMFFFSFTSVVANYYFGETAASFMLDNRAVILGYRLLALTMIVVGALLDVPVVWTMADLGMGLMAVCNLTAILLLSPIAFKVWEDYKRQVEAGREPMFDAEQVLGTPSEIWNEQALRRKPVPEEQPGD